MKFRGLRSLVRSVFVRLLRIGGLGARSHPPLRVFCFRWCNLGFCDVCQVLWTWFAGGGVSVVFMSLLSGRKVSFWLWVFVSLRISLFCSLVVFFDVCL